MSRMKALSRVLRPSAVTQNVISTGNSRPSRRNPLSSVGWPRNSPVSMMSARLAWGGAGSGVGEGAAPAGGLGAVDKTFKGRVGADHVPGPIEERHPRGRALEDRVDGEVGRQRNGAGVSGRGRRGGGVEQRGRGVNL